MITWVQPDFTKHSEQTLGYEEMSHTKQFHVYLIHKSHVSFCSAFIRFFSAHLTISLNIGITSKATTLSQITGFGISQQLFLRSKQNIAASKTEEKRGETVLSLPSQKGCQGQSHKTTRYSCMSATNAKWAPLIPLPQRRRPDCRLHHLKWAAPFRLRSHCQASCYIASSSA